MSIQSITCQDLKKMMNQGHLVVIDVREESEFSEGFIKGSLHIPLGDLTADKIPNDVTDVVFYCRSGVRSFHAAQKILESQPTYKIYNLTGGITAWNQALSHPSCETQTSCTLTPPKSISTCTQSKTSPEHACCPLARLNPFIGSGIFLLLSTVLVLYVDKLFSLFHILLAFGLIFKGMCQSSRKKS